MEKPSNAVNRSPAPAQTRQDTELEYIKQFHDEAYRFISEGLSLEEKGDDRAALSRYENGLRLIDQSLSFQPRGDGPQVQKGLEMQKKLRRTRLEILERLQVLQVTRRAPVYPSLPNESPPSYEEAIKESEDERLDNVQKTSKLLHSGGRMDEKLADMNTALNEIMENDMEPIAEIPQHAEKVFSLNEVQIFFVSAEGFVSAPSYPTSLVLYRFKEEAGASPAPARAPAFLQVGEWVYPLMPGRSPVLQSNYGAYLFPDINNQQPGSAVGLLLPEELDDVKRTLFEQWLCELTMVRVQGEAITPDEDEKRFSRKLSNDLVKGAEMLAKGLYYGAEQTTRLVRFGAGKLRQNMKPAKEPVAIDPKWSKGVAVTREVTGAAVVVSGFVVRKVGEATMSLGRYLAPKLRHHGSRFLSQTLNEHPKQSGKKIDNILEVAAGGLKGFATVYVGLESAARILATNLTNETVQLVNYKYGAVAGDVTDNALNAAGNIAVAAHNVSGLGVKGIAKKAAKSTGKALVEDYEQRNTTSELPNLEKESNKVEKFTKEKGH